MDAARNGRVDAARVEVIKANTARKSRKVDVG